MYKLTFLVKVPPEAASEGNMEHFRAELSISHA